jgi:hypothetical protein
LLIGDLQPLASPDALDPLVIDDPARLAEQPCNLAIAVAAVSLGRLDNIGRQALLVFTAARDLALRRAPLGMPDVPSAPARATSVFTAASTAGTSASSAGIRSQ